MKFKKIFTFTLAAAACWAQATAEAQTTTTIADPAADFVEDISIIDPLTTVFPDGWTYLQSDASIGGTEVELVVVADIGNANNPGFGSGAGGFQVPAVVGTHEISDEFEVFTNGFEGNGGVVGVDLLMTPGFDVVDDPAPDGDEFVIARYTVSAADVSGAVAGTGSIVGSFRDLVTPNNLNANNSGSIDVFLYHNATLLFSVDRPDDIANASLLTVADGSFNVTGLTFAAGDTVSFVIGNNGNIGADESALQAAISVETSGGGPCMLGDVDLNGTVEFLDIQPFIGILSSSSFQCEADCDEDGMVTFLDIQPFIQILAGN